MPKKRIRKFVVTVEEVIDDDSQETTHQEPPPIQTRDQDGTWFKQVEEQRKAEAKRQRRLRHAPPEEPEGE